MGPQRGKQTLKTITTRQLSIAASIAGTLKEAASRAPNEGPHGYVIALDAEDIDALVIVSEFAEVMAQKLPEMREEMGVTPVVVTHVRGGEA